MDERNAREPLTDDQLDIRCFAAGERSAAKSLYERHATAMYRLADRLTGGRSDLAEEAVQEAFVRAFRSLDDFRGEAAFATWLGRIVVTCVLDLQRRDQRMEQRFVTVSAADEVASDDRRVDVDLRDAVTVAVDRLPEAHRMVLVMHDVEGYSHREIAEVMKTPSGTVRRKLVEARARVRDDLKRLGHDGP